jgi:hypothetical protein
VSEPAAPPPADAAAPATRLVTPGKEAETFRGPAEPAGDGTALVFVATLSHIRCPQIPVSVRADCGFEPLPQVTISVATEAGEVVTSRTDDDGSVRVPVNPGTIRVRGAAVSDDLSKPPMPVSFEVVPNQIRDVLLVYDQGSDSCHRHGSARFIGPHIFRHFTTALVIARGECP